jgi:hypothetical protein
MVHSPGAQTGKPSHSKLALVLVAAGCVAAALLIGFVLPQWRDA